MELKKYFFKGDLKDSHTLYGVIITPTEKCPINENVFIGSMTCINKSCCKEHAPHMRIVSNIHNNWIMCEETTKMKIENPSLGNNIYGLQY